MSKFLCISWLLINIISPCWFCALSFAASEYLPPMTKKNKNVIDNYFDQQIQDKRSLESNIEQLKNESVRSVENQESLKMLPESSQVTDTANRLGSLDQGSVERESYEVMNDNRELVDKLHPNYNDPQIRNHQRDINKIAGATDILLGRLTDKLKELGIDCKQTKGLIEKEPEMYIEIEQEKQKEVIYDKFFCEHLRNSYNCIDELVLQCQHFSEKGGGINY